MNWFWRVAHWLRDKEREANLADYLIVLLTAAIVFWGGMSWWEMHDAGKQTDKLIYLYKQQALATNNLVRVTDKIDETARMTQRAFVYYTGVHAGVPILDPISHKITSIQFFTTWDNSGITRTNKAITWTNFKFTPMSGLPKDFSFPYDSRFAKTSSEIGARNTLASIPFRLSIDNLRDVREHRKRIYVWGEATYYDIFNAPQNITKFCSELINLTATTNDLTDLATTHINMENVPCEDNQHDCHDETCQQ
jgi:hypothetical protein